MTRRVPPLVVLTGPIGSGKSTVGRLAVQGLSLRFVPEDVDSLPEDREVLARYYGAVLEFEEERGARSADAAAIAAAREVVYRTQEHFIRRRAALLREATRGHAGCLVERHPSDDIEIFSRRNLEKGLLTEEQFADLERLSARELAEVPEPALTAFLHAEPARLRERIRHRGRPQEADLLRTDNPYLEELDRLYRSWFERCRGGKVLVRTDDLHEAEIAAQVQSEIRRRGIV